jgi:hypothetical protein
MKVLAPVRRISIAVTPLVKSHDMKVAGQLSGYGLPGVGAQAGSVEDQQGRIFRVPPVQVMVVNAVSLYIFALRLHQFLSFNNRPFAPLRMTLKRSVLSEDYSSGTSWS